MFNKNKEIIDSTTESNGIEDSNYSNRKYFLKIQVVISSILLILIVNCFKFVAHNKFYLNLIITLIIGSFAFVIIESIIEFFYISESKLFTKLSKKYNFLKYFSLVIFLIGVGLLAFYFSYGAFNPYYEHSLSKVEKLFQGLY